MTGLFLAVAALVLAAGYLLFQVVRQNGRILMRLDAVERELALMRVPAPSENAEAEQAARGNRPLRESRLLRTGLPAGTRAPVFTLPRVGGGDVSLSQFAGEQVLLVFSDPHCGPCMALAPDLERHHRAQRGPQVVMVSRRSEEENAHKAAQLGLTFPIGRQREWDLSLAYGMFATPVAFFIDERGVIARDVLVGADAIRSALASR